MTMALKLNNDVEMPALGFGVSRLCPRRRQPPWRRLCASTTT